MMVGSNVADWLRRECQHRGRHVIFGEADGSADVDVDDIDPGQGFTIRGVGGGDGAGFSLKSAGDVNGDGFDDIVIGARRADGFFAERYNAGDSYVVFGTDQGFPVLLDLGVMTPDQGFAIYGEARYGESGSSVSSAGDINGDGFDEC